VESSPLNGEGEDLIFFHAHLDIHGAANAAAGRQSLMRAGTPADPVLLYRWSPASGTARVSRQQLLRIRTAAFERRVLWSSASASASSSLKQQLYHPTTRWARFAIWGAGRDGRNFLSELSDESQRRVVAMIDVDPKKCGKTYANHRCVPPCVVPVVHFTEFADWWRKTNGGGGGSGSGGGGGGSGGGGGGGGEVLPLPPVVVCVAKRRKGPGEVGDLERNVETLGLVDGENLWYFM